MNILSRIFLGIEYLTHNCLKGIQEETQCLSTFRFFKTYDLVHIKQIMLCIDFILLALHSSEITSLCLEKQTLDRYKKKTFLVVIFFRSAYDVNLADDGWNSNLFEIVNGNTSKSWEKLDV